MEHNEKVVVERSRFTEIVTNKGFCFALYLSITY